MIATRRPRKPAEAFHTNRADAAERFFKLRKWAPMRKHRWHEGGSKARQNHQRRCQSHRGDGEGGEQRSPCGVEIAAVPEKNEGERRSQDIGGVIGHCGDQQRRDCGRSIDAAPGQPTHDHQAATEAAGRERRIGEKFDEREPEKACQCDMRPGAFKDDEPDQRCAEVSGDLAKHRRRNPDRIGAADRGQKNFDGAEMQYEDDQTSKDQCAEKPGRDQ